MSILTHDIILEKISSGEIKIDPFDESLVGPASVDFKLDKTFRIFKKKPDITHLNDGDFNQKLKDVSELIEVADHYTLHPGELIHGITVEKLTLPPNICAWIEGRSSLGRLGLTVHITASFVQPGVANKQVLEISNVGPVPLVLYPGVSICQVIFQTTVGAASYSGRYQQQTTP